MAKSKGRTVLAPDEMWARAEAEAARRGLGVADWVRMLMADALNGEAYVAVKVGGEAPKAAPVDRPAASTRPEPAQPLARPPAEKLAVARVALADVERGFGPPKSAPGSRLKRVRS
jgi:hypothetical protein